MDIGVEISLYPLTAAYAPAIRRFIARLEGDPHFKVVTNSMSTQVFGPFEEVMQALRAALGASFASMADGERAVFVMKVFGPLTSA
jgi:uncharacterized protein YqgV (UPF0045/DUF77 family)